MSEAEFPNLTHPILKAINQCSNLMTDHIGRVDERAPFVEVAAGIKQDKTVTMAGIQGVHPLEITDESARFRLTFPNPVCFAVTDEMFANRESNAPTGAGWVTIFRVSAFLEFVQSSTWAKDDYPGPLSHVQIFTLDHRIDVVTAEPPGLLQI